MSEEWADWIGRQEQAGDELAASRCNALLSALGETSRLTKGDPLPLLYHWLYFWDVKPPAALGEDGHPARGGFLPPVPLPRRMWAGGRLNFLQQLRIGEPITRISTIRNITTKTGRSGQLVFVTVQHEVSGAQGVAIVEEQDLVYRDPAPAASVAAAGTPSPNGAWHRSVDPDSVLLFRYSALTMNGHRIHYDRPYAVAEEAYPGLVVHGPLQATLLADLAVKNLSSPIKTFSFRGQTPAFDGAALQIYGNPTASGAALWTAQAGATNMAATVTC
jgi:3-methylfumaryl-CoA hydratase